MVASAIADVTVGASLSALTVIETVSALLAELPSFTVRENTSVYAAVPCGAVKVGALAVELERETDVPLVWLNE